MSKTDDGDVEIYTTRRRFQQSVAAAAVPASHSASWLDKLLGRDEDHAGVGEDLVIQHNGEVVERDINTLNFEGTSVKEITQPNDYDENVVRITLQGGSGSGGAFEDTDGDGVAELQDDHADFGGGDARNIGSIGVETINNVESVQPSERDIGSVVEGAGAGTVVVAENGTHTPSSNFTVPNDVGIHLRPNATIQAPDLPDGEKFIVFGGTNQFLTGRGTIDGNRAAQSVLDTAQAIVGVQSADNFYLNGPTFVNAPGGDGLYITSLREGLLENFVVDDAYRNGVSIVSGRDYTVRDFLVMNTGGAAPEAGVDIEPNAAGQSLARITVEDFRLLNNADQGMQVHTKALNSGDEVDVTIRDGYASGNDDGFDFARAFNGSPGIFAAGLEAVDNTTFGFNIGAAGPLYLRETVAKNNGSRNYEAGDTDTVSADNPIIEDAHSISTGSTTDRSANLRGTGQITVDGLRITGTYATSQAVAVDDGLVDYRHIERTDSKFNALNFPARMTPLQQRLRDVPGATASDLDDAEVAFDSTNGRIVWKDETGSAYYVSGTAL